MKRIFSSSLAAAAIAAFALISGPAFAQALAPDLGSAAPYAVLGTNSIPTVGTVTCTDTGPGVGLDGQVGTTFPGGITNTGPCVITGPIDAPVLAAVVTDFNAALASIDTMNPVCDGPIPTTTATLTPGVYCSAAGTTIGAGVTLTLNGNASDVWIFRVGTGGGGALTLTDAQVVMGGTADACNVYWKTAEAASVTDSDFVGTVLSGDAATMTRGSWLGRALATTDVTLTDPDMTFAGCAALASITVSKDFVPNNPAPVAMALTCSSGTVMTTPLNAAEGAPAVFSVAGANVSGTTCTATETVPAGYTANQADCVDVPLGGSCTIINTLDAVTITVNKDFIPNNPLPVAMALTCSSGVVDTTPLNAAEGAPAIFTITGALPGATCTATETIPAGYTANQADCVDVPMGGSCTIINTLASATITVNKDFIPNSAAPVPVALTCSSGTVTTTPLNAAEGAPAVFTVTGALPGATCAATETVPAGYTADQTDCVSVAMGGSCTIINTLIAPISPGVTNVPTLSGWVMILFAGLLALFGFVVVRRRAVN